MEGMDLETTTGGVGDGVSEGAAVGAGPAPVALAAAVGRRMEVVVAMVGRTGRTGVRVTARVARRQ